MISLSALVTRVRRPDDVAARDRARFGDRALAIRSQVAEDRQFALTVVLGVGKTPAVAACRHEIAYRAWTECRHLSLADVAALVGRRDHSAAIHSILAGARARGIVASRVSDLREDKRDPIDWTKLAYHAAGARERTGLSLDRAAAAAGIARVEWRKVEQGRSVSAGTMLKVCRHLGLDPFSFLAVSHETAVEKEPAP